FTGHVGQAEVEDDCLRLLGEQGLQPAEPVRSAVDRVTTRLQGTRQSGPDARVVLDDEHMHHGRQAYASTRVDPDFCGHRPTAQSTSATNQASRPIPSSSAGPSSPEMKPAVAAAFAPAASAAITLTLDHAESA